MLFPHSARVRRVAACTALVLSAGTVLTGIASAGTPAPRPAAEKPVSGFVPPTLERPAAGASRAGATGTAGVGASPLLSDFDRDGFGDLIYRAWDGNLYTATAAGRGGLFLGKTSQPVKDVIPIGNQDGDVSGPEVLTLSAHGVLSLYRNASPTSASYAWQGRGWQIYNKLVAPGDVNDDGRADLLAREHNGDLYLYYATGDRNAPFSARVKVGHGWNGYDQVAGIGDNNGDGWADLIARDPAGTLWFYAGRGDKSGPFAARVRIGGGWNAYNQFFPVGDDTGDGNGELIARDQQGTFWYYTGRGDGTFTARQQLGKTGAWSGITQFGGAGNIPVTLEKDGVMARDKAGTLFWYGSTNTGRLDARAQYGDTGGWAGADFTYLSTLDPDGSSDLAQLLQNKLYVEGRVIGSGWGVYNALVGPGDLTGDGKGDLLAREKSGVLYLYPGNGAGTGFAARVRVGSGWGAYDRIVGAGDYTGDGRSDLVSRTPGGVLYLYAGTGSAKTPFKTRQQIGTGWHTYSKVIAPGDLNADGKGDLLGVASNGDLYAYLNASPGKFTPRARIGNGYGIYNAMS
ncbi:FG-GAP repeat domain-containing protein [Streptomyces sp. NPDC085463]|uniref:FG-GAP repeat domain-containing protein n=1 Tax=Streptomyces sp. NPDC085463 TaxID=3365724 RepID=UPI0037CDAD2F